MDHLSNFMINLALNLQDLLQRGPMAEMENQCLRSKGMGVESIPGHPETTSRILFALLLQLCTETHQGPCTDRTVARLTQIAQIA